jgi:hypothetical protein
VCVGVPAVKRSPARGPTAIARWPRRLEIESVTLVHDPIVASAALTLEQASQEMKDFRKREAALAESHLSPGAVIPDGPLPAVPDVTYELELEGVGRDE